MTTGLPLFDAADAERRRQAGIARVTSHHSAWVEKAVTVLRRIAAARAEFTSDDLRAVIQEQPPSPNAVGAAFAAAEAQGICEGTDRFVKSARPEARRRRIQVWRRCE